MKKPFDLSEIPVELLFNVNNRINQWGEPIFEDISEPTTDKASDYWGGSTHESSPGRPFIPFDPKGSQEDFVEYVKLRADHIPVTGLAIGSPDQFEWSYDPEHPLDFSYPIKKDWAGWFQGEQDEWEYNHGDEKKGHFENWAKNPEQKPVIIVDGLDGKLHLWDGHHRVGMAHKAGMKTIPAIIGKRKV